MSKNTSIEWTHHTFNPWWGCAKVSPGCQHCYAETFSKRVGQEIWGQNEPRRFFDENFWGNPLKWNAEAQSTGERKRVFCASMADVFESRADLDPWREKLWDLILKTPMLDWLLLTKRPENIEKMAPWTNDWPENIWLGTTVENQEYADKRLPHLLKHKSKVRFLSCEPLLGDVDLDYWIKPNKRKGLQGIDWIIAGGESGPGARPMNPNWARNLRDQAQSAGTPFLFKQWGQWATTDHIKPGKHGRVTVIEGIEMTRLKSKYDVNRELDGHMWDEFPVS
ncbi:MAG: phage Gp37/Gp68 family protein [Verrucomicrobia bacterium]|nr:MAG: phage Gp37/Gp68 family protein [Verrucomicrobiota bacterium]